MRNAPGASKAGPFGAPALGHAARHKGAKTTAARRRTPRAAARTREALRRALVLVVDDDRLAGAVDDLVGDDALLHFRKTGQVIHHVEHRSLHDRAQATCAG